MKTAEELFRENFTPGFAAMPPHIPKYIYESMVEFAQMHVEEALKTAWNNIEFNGSEVVGGSIINAYPETNIK